MFVSNVRGEREAKNAVEMQVFSSRSYEMGIK